MTLLQKIDEALHANDQTAEERSQLLTDFYLDANFSQRATLNQFSLTLCGARLEDLIGTTATAPPIPLSEKGFPRPELRQRPPILITHELADRLIRNMCWELSVRTDLEDEPRFKAFIADEGPHVLRQLFEDYADLSDDLHYPPTYHVRIGVMAEDQDEATHAFFVDQRGYPSRNTPAEWMHIARIDLAEWQARNFPAVLPDVTCLPLESCGFWIRFDESEYYILPHPDYR